MMEIKADNIILMEHPLFRDEYTIAKVVRFTAKMVSVSYWKSHRAEFSDEIDVRTRRAIIRVIYPEAGVLEAKQMQQFADRLISARAEKDNRIKAAKAAYAKTIQGLEIR